MVEPFGHALPQAVDLRRQGTQLRRAIPDRHCFLLIVHVKYRPVSELGMNAAYTSTSPTAAGC
ncbi:hypothetical protein CH92_18740 [Stutzerimonas stutzeri]|uniref:Uncharacterized protein n=1 Tax=Stutzerimonas stutzeri TaxID=316 RepID=W8RGM8_STUST|nr:hypothetical protein CH92_18740 [Stutzerimonas stutzeri]